MDQIGKFQKNMEICSRSKSSQHDFHVPIYNLTDYQKRCILCRNSVI